MCALLAASLSLLERKRVLVQVLLPSPSVGRSVVLSVGLSGGLWKRLIGSERRLRW